MFCVPWTATQQVIRSTKLGQLRSLSSTSRTVWDSIAARRKRRHRGAAGRGGRHSTYRHLGGRPHPLPYAHENPRRRPCRPRLVFSWQLALCRVSSGSDQNGRNGKPSQLFASIVFHWFRLVPVSIPCSGLFEEEENGMQPC